MTCNSMELFFLFRNNPTFLACMLCSVMAIMKSYPALGDTALSLSLLALWIHVFPCKPILEFKLIFFVSKRLDVASYCREYILFSSSMDRSVTGVASPTITSHYKSTSVLCATLLTFYLNNTVYVEEL